MRDEFLMISPGCMFSVAMIQRFRLPPATSAMSADLRGGRGGGRRGRAVRAGPTALQDPPAAPGAHLHGSYRTPMTFSVPSS